MDRGRVYAQTYLLATLRRTTRRNTGDNLVSLAILDGGLLAGSDEGAVQVGVSSELLDNSNVESDALAGEGECLRADTEGELGLCLLYTSDAADE